MGVLISPLHRTHKVLDIRQIEELVCLSDEWAKRKFS